jgi:hypothetical protein
MEANELISQPLNEQQLHMLRLFRNPMPEESFLQIRHLVVKLLSEQMSQTIDQWETENGITEEYYNELAKGHFRSASK